MSQMPPVDKESFELALSMAKDFGPIISRWIQTLSQKLKPKWNFTTPLPQDFRYKILFIGGGEIALEIALAGAKSEWEPSCVDDPDETIPMEKLSEIAEEAEIARFDRELFKGIDLLSVEFTEAQRPTLSELEDFISAKTPNIVLMENNFIPVENWKYLCRVTEDYNLRYKKVHFLPNRNSVDFFCNKIEMKKKIESILGEEYHRHLTKCIVIDLSENRQENIRKIGNFIELHKAAILKPPIAESGHGQSVIYSKEDIEIALDKLLVARVRPKKALLEEKKKVISEIYYGNFRPISNLDYTPKIIGPIKYKKTSCGFGGPVRLEESCYPPDKITKASEEVMKNLLNQISEAIKVPFLGVEYFLCENNGVYINEITWRPDDAGFITLLSHERSQFDLFIDSLRKSEIEEPIINNGKFHCITLMRENELKYFPNLPMIHGNEWLVHFYQKGFPTTFRRIVGYAVVNLKGSPFSTIDKFKDYLYTEVLVKQFGKEDAKEFYY